MPGIKETLLSTMKNGPEVLRELEYARKVGSDFTIRRGQVDRKISELHPERLYLTLVEAEMVTPFSRRLRFTSRTGYLPPFEAGMYINLFVEKEGVLTSRPYSLSSSPLERGYYEITVEEVPDGFVSSYLVREAEVGDFFEAVGPAGYFHDNPVFHKRRKVFLAGGSGVTPFYSMIQEALERTKDLDLTLFYGIRTIERALYHEKLLELSGRYTNFKYVPVLSDSQMEGMEKGFITKDLILRYIGDPKDYTYYLCGPEVMVSFCIGELGKMDISKGQIRRELFGSRRDIWNEKLWPQEVASDAVFKMKIGDEVYEVKASESILTSLERNNIRVNVCCRSGECSLCRVRLISGKVFNAPGALMRYSDARYGIIHSCKAYPVSDVEIKL